MDKITQDVISYFDEANDFIDECLLSNGKILIHW